jgi:hypothetical protein
MKQLLVHNRFQPCAGRVVVDLMVLIDRLYGPGAFAAHTRSSPERSRTFVAMPAK